jgi:KUP system potassium uptake protein
VLFLIQRTARVVGKLFGPIMVVWFLALGALGLIHLVQAPGSSRRSTRLRGVVPA